MLKIPFENGLGKLLRTERKSRRFTQAVLAVQAKLSIPTIRLLERGKGSLRAWERTLAALRLTLRGRNLPQAATLGRQIAMLRRRRGIGQRGLANLIGVSQPTLVKLERRSEGRLRTVDRVLGALGAGPKLVPHGAKVKFFTHTNASSSHHGWGTPKQLLETLYQVFGRFDLDPCSPSGNARTAPVRARVHFTVEDDGLSLPWHGAVFVNPPYGRCLPDWTAKASHEAATGNAGPIVALVPARTDTRWWHRDIASKATVLFLRGRLAFGDAGQSAPFPSALVVWNGTAEQISALQNALPTAWTPQSFHPPVPDQVTTGRTSGPPESSGA